MQTNNSKPPETFLAIFLKKFRRNKLAVGGGLIVILLFIIAFSARIIAPRQSLNIRYTDQELIDDGYRQVDSDTGRHYRKNLFNIGLYQIVKHISEPLDSPFVYYQHYFLGNEQSGLFFYDPFASDPRKFLNQKGEEENFYMASPSRHHIMGTDKIGRDIFSRMLWGARISLLVGFVSVLISVTIGMIIGSLAGYFGGKVDMVFSRLIEVMMCFPSFFLILAVIAILGPSIWNVMIVIGLTTWTGVARLIRGEILSQKEREYVQAARVLGASHLRIIILHLIPNSLAPVLVSATLGIAAAILTESGLSFLGLGVMPPSPSWGNILTEGRENLSYWWLSTFPGLAIFITVMGYNLLGEGLRDSLDPKLNN